RGGAGRAVRRVRGGGGGGGSGAVADRAGCAGPAARRGIARVTEYLWSPWRIEYIKGPRDDSVCIFCEKPAAGDDETSRILARNDGAFVMLNAYPYNPGHLMVAPFRHTGDYESLSPEELLDANRLIQASLRVLREREGPHGFNLGMNLARTAGAGIPDHLHWHIVPRWN